MKAIEFIEEQGFVNVKFYKWEIDVIRMAADAVNKSISIDHRWCELSWYDLVALKKIIDSSRWDQDYIAAIATALSRHLYCLRDLIEHSMVVRKDNESRGKIRSRGDAT